MRVTVSDDGIISLCPGTFLRLPISSSLPETHQLFNVFRSPGSLLNDHLNIFTWRIDLVLVAFGMVDASICDPTIIQKGIGDLLHHIT
ncbi:unnamed protein product [Dovyalis caffra]|uniref:Uncharacterized protein n=1 Tax=Dovyalis caffra TaxID=77055 RepID=A0AAV1QXM8_9ROSI|nr:unnamed protein product [Dovyalis caffra]